MQPSRAGISPKEADIDSTVYELDENAMEPQYWVKKLDWVKSPSGFPSAHIFSLVGSLGNWTASCTQETICPRRTVVALCKKRQDHYLANSRGPAVAALTA